MNIPVSEPSAGILVAIDRAKRWGSTEPLARWFRGHPGVPLDQGEAEALAAFLESVTVPQPAHAPSKLSDQQAGAVIARVRAFERTGHVRGDWKPVKLALAEEFGVSERTIDSIARKARSIPIQRNK